LSGFRNLARSGRQPAIETGEMGTIHGRAAASRTVLAQAVPEITELDLNPVMVLAAGKDCRIVDASIKVALSPRPV
jgi:hypothetical protein